ncbi:MAG: Ig-like domain-containing protein [Clostridiales Family XIII bacterium]|nr:Ig-like domain-containing protein [Clostridiales Family XIII bacterium]
MERTKKSGFIVVVFIAALLFAAPAFAFAEESGDPEYTAEQDDASAADVENNANASLTFVSTPATMNVGERAVIQYELGNASGDTVVTWASSNDSVASVDSKGEVTAGSPGSVEITASVPSLGLKTSAMIKVTEIPPAAIAIRVSEYSSEDMLLSVHDITVEETLHLSVAIEPENVTIPPAVEWSSSDEKVLTVNASGVVTAVAEGEATVTARAGDLTDRMKFNVQPQPGGVIDKYLLIGFGVLVALILAFIIIIITRVAKRRRGEREELEVAQTSGKREAPKKPRGAPPRAVTESGRQTRIFTPPENGDMANDASVGEDDPFLVSPTNGDVSNTALDDANEAETPGEPAEGYDDGPDRPFSLDDID